MIDIAKTTTRRPMPCNGSLSRCAPVDASDRVADRLRRPRQIAKRELADDQRRDRDDDRQHHDGAAPAEARDQRRGAWEECGAGQAARHRHGGDRAQPSFRVREGAADDREHRLVEDRGHAQTERGPHDIGHPDRRHERPRDQEPCCEQATGLHHSRPLSAIGEPPNSGRRDRGNQQAEREGAGDQPSRRIERVLQRHEQDAERKEQDAPVDQLTAADRPDRPWVHHASSVLLICRSDDRLTACRNRIRSSLPPSPPHRRRSRHSLLRLRGSAAASASDRPAPHAARRRCCIRPSPATPARLARPPQRRPPASRPPTRLFVSGREQERRRAAVALHADDVEILFGMRELAGAVRTHRAAAVFVGIDQRSERRGHSSHGSSAEPHFRQHLEIGTEAGADDRPRRHRRPTRHCESRR